MLKLENEAIDRTLNSFKAKIIPLLIIKDKYYVLGGLPYLLANFMYVLIKPIAGVIELTTAFTFASFFLFLAVLPLIYSPETLPEKKIKERELSNYLQNAQKIKEKYA